MNILKKLKQVATKEVIGSTLKSSIAHGSLGKKGKAAAVLIAAAGLATAVAEYL